MKGLGRHLIFELYDCDPAALDDTKKLEEALLKAAERAGMKVCGSAFHKFNPHGVTGVVIVAESHLSIHTWPEYGYAALDIFTCGEKSKPWEAYEEIAKILKPKNMNAVEVKRGLINVSEKSSELKRT